jgi:hypothetical protein
MEMKGNTGGHGTLAHSRPFRPPMAFAGGTPPRMPAKETAPIPYPSASTDRSFGKGVSQASDYHRHRLPHFAKWADVHPSCGSFHNVTAMIAKMGRERIVFEGFLLLVSLAGGEARRALGGPAGWRTENEREYHVRPSSMNDFKKYTFRRLVGWTDYADDIR